MRRRAWKSRSGHRERSLAKLSQSNRVATMANKLVVYADRAGVDDVTLVEDAYWASVNPRVEYFGNVFDFDVLHPARTALIVIELTECRNALVIAAAQLVETHFAELRLAPDSLPASVLRLAGSVPSPLDIGDSEALLEALVTADNDVALVAVAERLDHARHLHMRDPSLWPSFYQQIRTVYLPIAGRLHPELYARFNRWANAFRRRLR